MGFFFRCFNILCYASGFYMLLFFRPMFLTRARARVCVCVCVCVVHWHCTAQLSMFNMEKRFRNKIILFIIIIIIIIIMILLLLLLLLLTIMLIIIIINNQIYIAQFDTNSILTALYIVIQYIQMQYEYI